MYLVCNFNCLDKNWINVLLNDTSSPIWKTQVVCEEINANWFYDFQFSTNLYYLAASVFEYGFWNMFWSTVLLCSTRLTTTLTLLFFFFPEISGRRRALQPILFWFLYFLSPICLICVVFSQIQQVNLRKWWKRKNIWRIDLERPIINR